MLRVEDWAEVRRLGRSEGLAIAAIARRLGMSRNTVKRALASDQPPRYRRAAKGSIVDAVEPQIRALLAEFPDMPSTVIAERIGWSRGKTVLFDRIHQLRPLFALPDPAQRTEWLIAGLGAAPRALVWDNESAVGQWRGGRPQLTEAMNAFRGTLGINVVQCRPKDPEAKGLVERANGYLETSFLPGRRFASPADFNHQLETWLARANHRRHRALGCRPVDRVDADRAAMVPLPPVPPTSGWRLSTRLPRDHYVRMAGNDYSVHPAAVGRRVEVTAGLDRVVVCCDARRVAEHERCWAAHQTITDPAHREAAATLRAARRRARVPAVAASVEQRPLGDYDRVFGLAGESAVA